MLKPPGSFSSPATLQQKQARLSPPVRALLIDGSGAASVLLHGYLRAQSEERYSQLIAKLRHPGLDPAHAAKRKPLPS